MTALLNAELLKIRLTRSSYWWAAAAFALVAFAIGLTLALGTVRSRFDELSLLSFSGSGGLIVLLLGVAVGAGEYRHKTVIATLLFEPRRLRVWVNQATACAMVGLALGVACCALASLIVFPWLSAKGTPMRVSGGRLAADFLGSVVYCGISAVIGLSIGTLARNQVLAVSIVFIALAVIDPTISTISPQAGKFGPSAIGIAMTGGEGSTNGPFAAILGLPAATAVWGGLMLLLALAAVWRFKERDLT